MELLCKLCEMKYMRVVYTFGVSNLLRDKLYWSKELIIYLNMLKKL